MNYYEHRNPASPAREGNPHVSMAAAAPRANLRKHSDPVLGTVAIGSLLFILAWVVTGIDFLAIFGLLIALGYIRIAGALKSSEMSASAEFERRKAERLRNVLATGARSNGVATADVEDASRVEVWWKGGGQAISARSQG